MTLPSCLGAWFKVCSFSDISAINFSPLRSYSHAAVIRNVSLERGFDHLNLLLQKLHSPHKIQIKTPYWSGSLSALQTPVSYHGTDVHPLLKLYWTFHAVSQACLLGHRAFASVISSSSQVSLSFCAVSVLWEARLPDRCELFKGGLCYSHLCAQPLACSYSVNIFNQWINLNLIWRVWKCEALRNYFKLKKKGRVSFFEYRQVERCGHSFIN